MISVRQDQDAARAATEVGDLTVAEYLKLCEQHGWTPKVFSPETNRRRRAAAMKGARTRKRLAASRGDDLRSIKE